MKVLYVTSECAPFAKTGGLGDVMGSLPKAMAEKKVSTRVVMPLYECIAQEWRDKMEFYKYIYVPLAWRSLYCGIFTLKKDGVLYYFLDNEFYFKRGDLYGHFDDGERFAFFSRAVVEILTELDWMPDVIHCNDWETALVPIYLKTSQEEWKRNLKVVFTIHNIEYQGRYGKQILGDVFSLSDGLFYDGTLEFMGGISLMKGAIILSDWVTTVSPTYATELRYAYYTHGLEGVIAACSGKMSGILNGIDQTVFDPATDKNIVRNYTVDTLENKVYNKLELQQILGLNQDETIPVIGMVSRLVQHKGLDLVMSRLDQIMDMNVQLVVLGRGDWNYEQPLLNAQNRYPGRLSANIMYSADLSMKIYAGADMFLMPSQMEPCGLSQMIAMRYGTVPIVRETGGLKDTVQPYFWETGEGTGFTFHDYNADDMVYVIRQAVETFQYPDSWKKIQTRDMNKDFSWSGSAKEYYSLYKNITGLKR